MSDEKMDITIYGSDVNEAQLALQAAANAAAGDSNDAEIEALQECAELLAQLLGLEMPDAEEEG